MTKKLSEMTLEELWQLFPIILTEHSNHWRSYYLEEETALKRILPSNAIVNHIGSTAVPGIWAKPIVDILVEVEDEMLDSAAATLVRGGYIIMSRESLEVANTRSHHAAEKLAESACVAARIKRISLNKGYTEQGFANKVFHLHLRQYGDNAEIYFRDYLIAHPEVAKEYESLKLSLWKMYEHNRDAYTQAKTEFVKKYTKLAKMKRNVAPKK